MGGVIMTFKYSQNSLRVFPSVPEQYPYLLAHCILFHQEGMLGFSED